MSCTFLTVASYNLEHPAVITDEARTGLEQAFLGYLDGRLTVDGAVRVRRLLEDVHRRRRGWPMTIDAVAIPGERAHATMRGVPGPRRYASRCPWPADYTSAELAPAV